MPADHYPRPDSARPVTINDNFDQRVEVVTETQPWVPTNTPGVSIKPLEISQPQSPRLTLLVRFDPGARFRLLEHFGSEEILVLDGTLHNGEQTHATGDYLRFPQPSRSTHHSANGCLLFVKLGEFTEGDDELRVIQTQSSRNWLPGPVDGTEVLALHMRDTRSVLLIRWREAATFKPGLDPQGEEIFVIRGSLSDSHGTYGEHQWIRNPVPVWQEWSGDAGTLVYYKNGHFPDLTRVVDD